MEELLNTLIKKGWKPRQHTDFVRCNYCDTYSVFSFETENESGIGEHTLRQLVSKESGLWQFCTENELVKPVVDIISICSYSHFTDGHDDCGWDETFPEYRLIESSLKDESELEDFLLSNIKIEGKA